VTQISQSIRRSVVIAVAVGALAVVATDVSAQPRGGRGGRGGGHVAVVVAPPFYYYGYGPMDPFWGAYWSPYYGYGPWDYRHGNYDADTSSARLQVTPKTAEVYVDGYLAGTVDDFDGVLQRLNVRPGEHELTLYQDGYRTLREKVLFRTHATVKIKYDMQKLAAGETSGPRPEPPPQVEPPARAERPPVDALGRRVPPPQPPGPGRRERAERAERSDRGDFGTLAVRVQPDDARILVDGKAWDLPSDGPLRIELQSGSHDVDVQRDGFAPYRRTITVRPGTTTTLNVSLSR